MCQTTLYIPISVWNRFCSIQSLHEGDTYRKANWINWHQTIICTTLKANWTDWFDYLNLNILIHIPVRHYFNHLNSSNFDLLLFEHLRRYYRGMGVGEFFDVFIWYLKRCSYYAYPWQHIPCQPKAPTAPRTSNVAFCKTFGRCNKYKVIHATVW